MMENDPFLESSASLRGSHFFASFSPQGVLFWGARARFARQRPYGPLFKKEFKKRATLFLKKWYPASVSSRWLFVTNGRGAARRPLSEKPTVFRKSAKVCLTHTGFTWTKIGAFWRLIGTKRRPKRPRLAREQKVHKCTFCTKVRFCHKAIALFLRAISQKRRLGC